MHEVALGRVNRACGNFLLRNCVEAIEEVCGLCARFVAFSVPNVEVEVSAQLHGEVVEHLTGEVKRSERFALGGQRAVNRLGYRVQVKALDHGAKVGFERARLDVQAVVVVALRVVRTEFDTARELAEDFTSGHAGARGHVLQGRLGSDYRHHQEVLAVRDGGLLQFRVRDVDSVSHSLVVVRVNQVL